MNEAKAAIIAALITAIATLLATFITVYQPMKARFAALENKLADNEEETGAYTASSNTQAEITLQNAVILVVLALAIFYGCFYRPVRKELTELQKKLAGELPAHDPKGCKISSIDELYNNIIMNMAGSFYLSNDIDVAAEQGTWTPLGWQNDGDHIPFTGTLDGQGYTIRGLKNANDSMGLFQVLSGTVRNLHVDVNFSGGNGGAFAVSMTNNGLIECCEASGNIQTNVGCLIGGFVGSR
ncbi:MAG: hypothetical protein IKN96_08060 [Oscillibacter sp.]|nr:hypothetical protein [Oscillibacter sp.]